ncbi:MAG: excinuclease ABC subunit UvrB [Candidatus Omnitrophica bacterium]|nr:excinuclease ABC subunit UvrB [Candidatus Omnitrophota bacterium]MDD5429275.1 excinuclease ABC subunit UvrB [Candidatus Omnitrophota bacterium]
MDGFKLVSKFRPTGDQPQAIKKIVQYLNQGEQAITLLGATGSGKTFSLACAIEKLNRPVLVVSHNKTLASQLYSEFKDFFPQNAVEYFVSYYDYYQPESYIPQTDTYIEKDASINERLDRLRLSATSSLMMRRDVIVVASVSCIYNLGAPQDYQNLTLNISLNSDMPAEGILKEITALQYERNDYDFKRGSFRLKGDTLDIFPSYREQPLRIEFLGSVIDKMYEFDFASGKKISGLEVLNLYPAKHFVIGREKIEKSLQTIRHELEETVRNLENKNKILEAQRLRQRTLFDLEMLRECGYCHGIENYSRHLSGRPAGARPYCLIDYFPKGFLTVIDESHVTLPQLRGMYMGDKSRKETLVQYGFRLPSCLDNRPLRFDEFMDICGQAIYVSATPGAFELTKSNHKVIEQIIRPTGLLDPPIEVRPAKNQIDDLVDACRKRISSGERVLITTLTKRMSEQLTEYLKDEGLKVEYIHSEVETLERARILKDLRLRKFDILVGINLLREGLDLPEVSLVVILDADKEGFLRSATSLIQVAGRCARNVNGHVIMYADSITASMRKAINESARRREIQLRYNKVNRITPATIAKAVGEGLEKYLTQDSLLKRRLEIKEKESQLQEALSELEKAMIAAAKNLQFEKAAELRDKIEILKKALDDAR